LVVMLRPRRYPEFAARGRYRRNRSPPRSFRTPAAVWLSAHRWNALYAERGMCPGAEGARSPWKPGQSGHAVTAVSGSGGPDRGRQDKQGHTSVYELGLLLNAATTVSMRCSQQSSRPQKLSQALRDSGRLAPPVAHEGCQPGHGDRGFRRIAGGGGSVTPAVPAHDTLAPSSPVAVAGRGGSARTGCGRRTCRSMRCAGVSAG